MATKREKNMAKHMALKVAELTREEAIHMCMDMMEAVLAVHATHPIAVLVCTHDHTDIRRLTLVGPKIEHPAIPYIRVALNMFEHDGGEGSDSIQ
jgi:hypothetical protein